VLYTNNHYYGPRIFGFGEPRSLGRRSSTSRQRSQWRLTVSLRDGASATIDTIGATSKAARTRERRGAGTGAAWTIMRTYVSPALYWNQPHSTPHNHPRGARSHCDMTTSPAPDDRNKTARQTLYTDRY